MERLEKLHYITPSAALLKTDLQVTHTNFSANPNTNQQPKPNDQEDPLQDTFNKYPIMI